MEVLHPSTLLRYFGQVFLFLVGSLPATYFPIRSDIYFEIVGPIAFLSVRTDGQTVFGKFARIGVGHHRVVYHQYLFHEDSLESDR